jgi:hypothetical protein
MLRTTARNRVGNQLARTPGGESAATALAAPSDPISPLRSSRREQVADRSPARCAATPLSLRLGAPVSQRYRDVEDAL